MVELPEGWYSVPELELLAQCARDAPDAALVEVGVFKGRSATVLAAERGDRQLWLVDNMSMDGAGVDSWPSGYGIHWRNHSHEVPLQGIALLHHDACHYEHEVYQDLMELGNSVVTGGYVLLHDFHGHGQGRPEYPGVAAAWSRFRDESDAVWADAGRADSLQAYRRVK